VDDAESRSQRARQQSCACCRANQRELLQRYFYRARAGSLSDDDVELVIFHRRVQHFFDCGGHPVNFVDEEHFVLAEARENRSEIARPLQHRSRCRPHSNAELVADHISKRRFAEAGRAVEQHVIERFTALAGCGDRDLKICADALLADVVIQRPGAQPRFVLDVFIDPRSGHYPRV
jgi:hypothetical protein